jgi:hypothetical protein
LYAHLRLLQLNSQDFSSLRKLVHNKSKINILMMQSNNAKTQ